ncbi:MAG: hypothetical protein ACYC8T_23765 [Myxococcaceae bacterium]
MFPALALCFFGGCAAAPPVKPEAASPGVERPARPTQLVVSDHRTKPEASADLVEKTREFVLARLAGYQVPVSADAAQTMQVEIEDLGTRREGGRKVLCAKLTGRVVREGQAFVAIDVPAERCIEVRERPGWTGDNAISLLLATGFAIADALTPKPQHEFQRMYVDALSTLIGRLERQCR